MPEPSSIPPLPTRPSRGLRAAAGVGMLAAVGFSGVLAAPHLHAQARASVQTAAVTAGYVNPLQWMQRWQQAAATHAFAGTVVTSGERGNLRSARVWHAVGNGRQIERIDNLAGVPRSVFRTENTVTVFLPQQKMVRIRTNMPRFATLFASMPVLDGAQQAEVARHYRLVQLGTERVANHEVDVVGFVPADGLRHAFRFWSDKTTGLLLKWQMLEPKAGNNPFAGARMLREAAFSDVQVPAPLQYDLLAQMMHDTKDYTIRQRVLEPVQLQALGWSWRKPLPGYFVTHCFVRVLGKGAAMGAAEGDGQEAGAQGGADSGKTVTQCVLSDGLGSISLFMEPAASATQTERGALARGATRILTQKYGTSHVVTAVGDVPVAALQEVLKNLYRTNG